MRAPDALFLAVPGAAADAVPPEELVVRAAVLAGDATADDALVTPAVAVTGGYEPTPMPAGIAAHVREVLSRPRTSCSRLINYSLPPGTERSGMPRSTLGRPATAGVGARLANHHRRRLRAAQAAGENANGGSGSEAAGQGWSAIAAAGRTGASSVAASTWGGGAPALYADSEAAAEAAAGDIAATMIAGVTPGGPGRAPPAHRLATAGEAAAARARAAELEAAAPTRDVSKNVFAATLAGGRLPVAQFRSGVLVADGEIGGALGFIDGARVETLLTPQGAAAAGTGAAAAMTAVAAAAAHTAASVAEGVAVTHAGARLLAAFSASAAAASAAATAAASARRANVPVDAAAVPSLPAEAVYAVSQGLPVGQPDHALWQRQNRRGAAGGAVPGAAASAAAAAAAAAARGVRSADDDMISAHFAPDDAAAVAAAALLSEAEAAQMRRVHQTTSTVTLAQLRTRMRLHAASDARAQQVARFLPEALTASSAAAAAAAAAMAGSGARRARNRSRARAAAATAAAGLTSTVEGGDSAGVGSIESAALLQLGRAATSTRLDEEGVAQVSRAFRALDELGLEHEASADASAVERRERVLKELKEARSERLRYERARSIAEGRPPPRHKRSEPVRSCYLCFIMLEMVDSLCIYALSHRFLILSDVIYSLFRISYFIGVASGAYSR